MKTGQVELFDKVFDVSEISDSELGVGISIDCTQQYNAPFDVNYKSLKVIGDYFGTLEIDVDSIHEKGCETCDYGSRYGFVVQVYKITQNYPDMIEED